MILTNCAACAAPLAHDAPRCVRLWTRTRNTARIVRSGGNGEKLGQELLPVAMSAFGPGHLQTLNTRKNTAHGFMNDPACLAEQAKILARPRQ